MNKNIAVALLVMSIYGQLFSQEVCLEKFPVQGTVVEVSPQDNISEIANNAEEGSTILLASGTYIISSTIYLNKKNITLRSKTGNRKDVILDGNQGGTPLDNGNFVNTILAVRASDITVAHLTIRHARHHGIHISPRDADISNILLHDIRVYDNSQQQIKVNSNGDEASPKWVNASTLRCSLIEFIDNSIMQDNGSLFYTGGIDVHGGENWVVRHNVFQNIERDGKLMEHAAHFWNKCRGTLIENNKFYNNYRAIGLGMKTESSGGIERHYSDKKGDLPYYDHMDGIVRNNLIYNKAGIHLETGIEIMNTRDDQIYHNTIYSVDKPFNSMEYRWPNTQILVKNNLMSHQIKPRDGAKADSESNIEYSTAQIFQDITGLDFHLTSDALSKITRGTRLSPAAAGVDLDGNVISATPVPGAYQTSTGITALAAQPGSQNPSDAEGELPRFDIKSLKYQGAFRFNAETFGESTLNYSQGPITYNPDNHSLFIVGHSHQQAVAEFAIPELVNSTKLADLNMVQSPLQNFSPIISRLPNPEEMNRIGGLKIIGSGTEKKLLVNVYEYYDASATNTQSTLAFTSPNDLANSEVQGYYSFYKNPAHAAGWMSDIPENWQAPLGGNTITGFSSGIPIISRTSVGPTAFVFNVETFNEKQSGDINAVPILDFSLTNRLHEDLSNESGDNEIWTHLTMANYGMIIPETRTYATFGFSGGHESGVCYKCTQDDGNLCGGYCSHEAADNYNYYWLWDVDDLLQVKQGTKQPYEIRPYDYGKLTIPIGSQSAQIGGGAYNAKDGILYLSLKAGDREQGTYSNPPVIAAYKFESSAINIKKDDANPNFTKAAFRFNKISTHEYILSTPDFSKVTVRLYDPVGTMVSELNLKGQQLYHLNFNEVKQGIYCIQLRGNNINHIEKLVMML